MAEASLINIIAARAWGPLWCSKRWARLFRFSCVKLLISLVLFIFIAPFLEPYEHGPAINALLMSGVLITATMALGNRRWTLIAASCLAVPALAARWFSHLRPDIVRPEVFYMAGLLFVAFVVVDLIHYILRAPTVNSDVLCAGVSGYLLVGLLWSFAYGTVASLNPDAFVFTFRSGPDHYMNAFTSTYFSYVTLASVGYGDIVPVSPVARMLAILEAMTGTFYVAVMISRLVALHLVQKEPK